MTSQTDSIRNADLNDLAALLQDQHSRKLDLVVPSAKLRAENGLLVVEGSEPIIEADGVTSADGTYRPTVVCDEGVAEKLSIPVAYLKRLRAERPDLYDENVNGLLHGGFGPIVDDEPTRYAADARSFMLRTFRGSEGPGVARALLSTNYKIVDNFDVLTAALSGVRDAEADVVVEGCDLTERKMYVRVVSPTVSALAPTLLRNYRSPFDGEGNEVPQRAGWNLDRGRQAAAREGLGFGDGGEPIVFAGFVISNSEVGGGAFSITPRLVVQVCRNGLTITADVLRSIHLGGKLDEGVIRWSDDTQRKSLELVTAQARDAVSTFLDVSYVERVIARVEEAAGKSLAKPAEVVETVSKRLRFSEDQTASVLDHFIRGGQTTAGGLLNAVTSVAQTIDDADDAAAFEAFGIPAMELAASL